MKFFVALLLTALLSFVAGLYFQWWGVAPVAFGVALLIHQKAWKAFLAAFAGAFVLWVALAWWIDAENGKNLSSKVAELMGLGKNSFLLIIITGAVGGIVSGAAALSGSFMRSTRKVAADEPGDLLP